MLLTTMQLDARAAILTLRLCAGARGHLVWLLALICTLENFEQMQLAARTYPCNHCPLPALQDSRNPLGQQ
jgi:hypothetical protein